MNPKNYHQFQSEISNGFILEQNGQGFKLKKVKKISPNLSAQKQKAKKQKDNFYSFELPEKKNSEDLDNYPQKPFSEILTQGKDLFITKNKKKNQGIKEFEAEFPTLNSIKRDVKLMEDWKNRKLQSESENRLHQKAKRNKSNQPIPEFIRKKIFSTVEVPHFIFDETKTEQKLGQKKKQRNISMQLKRKEMCINEEKEEKKEKKGKNFLLNTKTLSIENRRRLWEKKVWIKPITRKVKFVKKEEPDEEVIFDGCIDGWKQIEEIDFMIQ